MNSKFPKNTVFKMHNVMMGKTTPQMVSVPTMGMERSEYGIITMGHEEAEANHLNDSSKRVLVFKEGETLDEPVMGSNKTLYKCASPALEVRPRS
jgi:hypothetical protein